MKKKIKVYGIHPSCKDEESFLVCFHITSLQNNYEFVWDEKNPDYIFVTEMVYRDAKLKRKFNSFKNNNCIRIFYAGEAVTPDFNIFDYAIGWDADLKNGDRFGMLPSQFEFANKGFIQSRVNEIKTLEEAKTILKSKTGFCCFLYSNPNAHPYRDIFFFLLSKYKQVDSLGKHLNNVKNGGGTGFVGHTDECVDIKSKYKFSIAFENATFRGYTSEKIYTSLNSHTVPIYWGDPCVTNLINPKAFINGNNFNSLDELVEYVKRIDNDDELWCKMVCEPWMTEDQYELVDKRDSESVDFIDHIFRQDLEAAKRVPVGCHPDCYKENWYDNIPKVLSFFAKVRKKIIMELKFKGIIRNKVSN